jgi:hypothetical protein
LKVSDSAGQASTLNGSFRGEISWIDFVRVVAAAAAPAITAGSGFPPSGFPMTDPA